jgi:hypothetical protein
MMTDTSSAAAIGTKLPLLFNFREALFGNRIVVEVQIRNGRALSVQESDGVWMYGVTPGAMAASGEDYATAQRAFREMFSNILKDFARESATFDAFKAVVKKFFEDTNPGYEREWKAAVEAVRRDGTEVPGLAKAPAESRPSLTIEVKQLAQIQPADNEADLQLAQAA